MLNDIVGQSVAVQILRNGIAEGRTGGSFLFAGPQHVGKYATALQFAKAILCENPQPGPDSCDRCTSCTMIDTGRHPDVRSVHPAGPSRILRMAQIWPRDGVRDFPAESALLHNLQYAPVRGKRRIFIIADADALNEDTANSILKVLEEPPDYATFILTASSVSSVLPTIFSRCQTVRFTSVAPQIITEYLRNHQLADEATARFLAAYVQGCIGEAIDLASEQRLQIARETVLLIAEKMASGGEPVHGLKLADDLRKAGTKLGSLAKDSNEGESSSRQSSVAVLEMLAYWYRDMLSMRAGSDESSLINVDHAARITQLAAPYDLATLAQALELIIAIRSCVERNANAQIAFEAMALRLITLRAAVAKR